MPSLKYSHVSRYGHWFFDSQMTTKGWIIYVRNETLQSITGRLFCQVRLKLRATAHTCFDALYRGVLAVKYNVVQAMWSGFKFLQGFRLRFLRDSFDWNVNFWSLFLGNQRRTHCDIFGLLWTYVQRLENFRHILQMRIQTAWPSPKGVVLELHYQCKK